jgi:hypothetical protein
MQVFNVQALNLTDKTRVFFERELPTKDAIVAVMSFSEASVYTNRSRRLDGALVITGPVVRVHVFTNAGLTRKYRGTMTEGTPLPHLGPDLSNYVFEHHQSVMAEFSDMCQNVYRAVSDLSKAQLEQNL